MLRGGLWAAVTQKIGQASGGTGKSDLAATLHLEHPTRGPLVPQISENSTEYGVRCARSGRRRRTAATVRAMAMVIGVCVASVASAAITGGGDTFVGAFTYVGSSGTGTLTIDAGSGHATDRSYLGYSSVSTGTATVSGAGSSWT